MTNLQSCFHAFKIGNKKIIAGGKSFQNWNHHHRRHRHCIKPWWRYLRVCCSLCQEPIRVTGLKKRSDLAFKGSSSEKYHHHHHDQSVIFIIRFIVYHSQKEKLLLKCMKIGLLVNLNIFVIKCLDVYGILKLEKKNVQLYIFRCKMYDICKLQM